MLFPRRAGPDLSPPPPLRGRDPHNGRARRAQEDRRHRGWRRGACAPAERVKPGTARRVRPERRRRAAVRRSRSARARSRYLQRAVARDRGVWRSTAANKKSRVRGLKRSMRDPNFILFLDAVLAAWTAFDLRRALVTGRARLWLGGTVTREHQPGPYWRYVYSNWAMLAFCAAIFVAMMSWPNFFR